MDRAVPMEGRTSIKVDGYGPIPVPRTIEEWMDPVVYPVQNINWYMSRQTYLEMYVPKNLINHFYYSEKHRQKFEQLLKTASGSEYLNLICNASHYITEPDHQQWLVELCVSMGEPTAEFIITDLDRYASPETIKLKELRNSIWQLIK